MLLIIGHPKLGLPFGQDRLIPIFIATLALRQNSRSVTFKNAAQILETFGLPKDGPHYLRLIDGFRRIFGATIFFGTEGELKTQSVDYARFHFFDRMKLWTQQPDDECPFQNQILLSESFWAEIQQHPIPINLEAVRILVNFPAELDFYTWLVWRSWTVRRETRVPLMGETGLSQQLGIASEKPAFEFRRQVKRWLDHIRAAGVWPDCPVELAPDGHSLILHHARALDFHRPPVEI